MNKQVKSIFFEVLDKTQKLQDCQKKSCKKEKAAGDKQSKDVQAQMMDLLKKVGNKKMTYKQFEKESDKIKEKTTQSKVSKDLLECSLKKCGKAATDMLSALAKTKLYDCKMEKKKEACAKHKKAVAILKKPKLDVGDYINFIKIIS